MSDQEIPVLPMVVPNHVHAIDPETGEVTTTSLDPGTFEFSGYTFPLPRVNEEGMVLGSDLLNTLMIALASVEDKKIRQLLKQAKIEIIDFHGKRFFPRSDD